jgi:hypothetical protein
MIRNNFTRAQIRMGKVTYFSGKELECNETLTRRVHKMGIKYSGGARVTLKIVKELLSELKGRHLFTGFVY